MAGKKRRGPTREQFTEEEWDRFGQLVECIRRLKAGLRARAAEAKP
jgi:hypothetical protein